MIFRPIPSEELNRAVFFPLGIEKHAHLHGWDFCSENHFIEQAKIRKSISEGEGN